MEHNSIASADNTAWCLQHWIAFQLLHALAQCHERGVCHGDIKCENVLVTSWDWVYLADFASYKPVRLQADNPVCTLLDIVCSAMHPYCKTTYDCLHCLESPTSCAILYSGINGTRDFFGSNMHYVLERMSLVFVCVIV